MAKQNADDFWDLLTELKKLLANTWGPDNRKYSRLFWDKLGFTKRVYSRFGIAGAAMSVADVITRRPVLMQPEDAGTKTRHFLTIDLPFLPSRVPVEKTASAKAMGGGTDEEFSAAVHRLFVRRREQQQLNVSISEERTSKETAGNVEFLHHLPSGFEPPDKEELMDRVYCPVGEVMWFVGLWRWALYVGSRRELTESIDDIDFDDVWDAPPRIAKCFFGDKIYFGYQTAVDQTIYAERLPESWMMHDVGEHGRDDPIQRLRRNSDVISDENSFMTDCQRLGVGDRNGGLTSIGEMAWNFFSSKANTSQKARLPQTIREIANYLHNFCKKQNVGKPVIHLLAWIHSEARFPVIPYYYLTVLDGSPKEHLVFPVLRSKEFPIDRRQRAGGQDKTTCAAVALFSLNLIPCENEQQRDRRLLEIEVFIKLLSERILDQAFYGRIQRELSEQNTERRRARITLHDLDWATGALLGHFEKLPAPCQAATAYLEFLRRLLRGAYDRAEMAKGPWKLFSTWFDAGQDKKFGKLFEMTFLGGYYRAQPANAVPRRPDTNGRQREEWDWDEMWKARAQWLDCECDIPDSWSWLAGTANSKITEEKLQIQIQFWILFFLISAQKHSIHYAFRHAAVVPGWAPAPSTIRKAKIRIRAEPLAKPTSIIISNLGNPSNCGGQSVSEAIPGEHSQDILATKGGQDDVIQVDDFSPSEKVESDGGVWWTGRIRISLNAKANEHE